MVFNRPSYYVDFRKLAVWCIPHVLRLKKVLSSIYPVMNYISVLHDRFITYQNYVGYQLQITPQVCYLEKALNDRYDFTDRRIFITAGVEYDPLVLYKKAEAKPLVLYRKSETLPKTLYSRDEGAIFGADFIINIPLIVPFDNAELIAFVAAYALPLKYRIKYF